MKKKTIDLGEKKQELLEVLQEQGEYIPAYCGGVGKCGKCKVRFSGQAPEPTENEVRCLTKKEREEGWRLACEVEVSGEISIELPDYQTEDRILVETEWKTEEILADPAVFCEKEAEKAQMEKGHAEAAPGDAGDAVVAVDIGTTTIVASAISQAKKTVEKTVSGINHQRLFGADVISRIEASNQGKGEELQKLICHDLKGLVEDLGLCFEKTPMIISGNTTMQHLLQGYSCQTLGVAPYTPVDISFHSYKNMKILPGVSTYVGADIVSGIIACQMDQKKEISLLVDIGTNGEMAIGNKNQILATSTAAGPALEGGNISCGMAGIPGAISSVSIENGKIEMQTIGNQKPVGICGTGVLETVYELCKAEIMDKTGRLDKKYVKEGFPLTKDIAFLQKDIREVQLAKAAIRAGIEILVKEFGVDLDQIDQVYLAGGFGQKINVDKAVGIGMIPEELAGKIVAVGNSSLAGAVMLAKTPHLEERFRKAAENAREISLAKNAEFYKLYIKYMSL